LQRTFVGAQDACTARLTKTDAKRKLENVETADWNENDRVEMGCASVNKTKLEQKFVKTNFIEPAKPFMKFSENQQKVNLRGLLSDVIYFEFPNSENASLNKTISILQKSGKFQSKFDAQEKKFLYTFDGQIIGEGKGESKKAAKKLADVELVETLKANCYTIRHKLDFYSPEEIVKPGDQAEANSKKLNENNLGFKMLKMLGWSGGSLGSKNEGIVDPVSLEIKIGRGGLGAESDGFDQKHIRNLLKNFRDKQIEYDLVFAKEFTKEERAQIHQIANQLNLRAKSFGKDSSRHLVISTKLSPVALRQKLLQRDQHLLEKYEIEPPKLKKTKKKAKQEED
jgi:hypothetical protein